MTGRNQPKLMVGWSPSPADVKGARVAGVHGGTRAELESEVRRLCERQAYDEAAALTVKDYGPEIFGFLVATLRSEQDANDAFSDFAVALLKGLPSFDWRCSLRTWAYVIARNASHRLRRDAGRRANRRAHGNTSALEEIAAAVRSQTASFLRTEKRTKLEALRDALPPEDRELLVLRVDRGLSWNEIALAMHDGEEPLVGDMLAREAQRLRKRFQLIRDKLREMARRAGLVD
jgi:RNA polymerase sigma-70 factor (ECF subfamily)